MANEAKPHVLIFPLPLQGPVNCLLKLAEILCLHSLQVTFLTTHHIQRRLFSSSATAAYFQKYATFRFETIPDGLPEDNPRTVDQFPTMMQSMEDTSGPALEAVLVRSAVPVTCVIAEGWLDFIGDVAKKVGVPLLCFDTFSPCAIWTNLCLPKLIDAGELPFKDDNLDEFITNAPGLEGIMRRRDLPSFCRALDILEQPEMQLVLKEIRNIKLARGLILNTFHDLDGPILSQLHKVNPNIYAVGPLQAHIKARLALETGPESQPINSSSIWKEDKSCISWLDAQPSRSVVYVSIGSLAVMTKDQLFEIWHGLVNSRSRFLWVRRPGSVIGLDAEPDNVPLELSQGTKERGYIVSWAPQEEVLAHRAIGVFLTHSGWMSTLESIIEGIPMICWPYFVDQQVNSRFVKEVWKVGLDMKDTCDRATVEKMVREVMESRKEEFLQRAKEMAKLAKSSVSPGGSSFADLDRLIEDIKLMKIPA